MKALFALTVLSMAMTAHATSIVKDATLSCKWTAFDWESKMMDSRTFNLVVSKAVDADTMVYGDELRKLGFNELEVQVVPQGKDFTLTSSLSFNFVLRRPGEEFAAVQGATFTNLQKKDLAVHVQVGPFVSSLECEVTGVTKL